MLRHTFIGLWVLTVAIVVFLLVRFGAPLLSPFLEEGVPTHRALQNSDKAVALGTQAPYFELVSLSGDRLRLSDLANTPLVVTFWATVGSDAPDQIKIIDDWGAAHPKAPFKIITVDSQEERSVVKSFIDRGGYTVSVLLDQTGETGKLFGVSTLPTSFFIDRQGIIREMYIGIMSQKMIDQKAELIIR